MGASEFLMKAGEFLSETGVLWMEARLFSLEDCPVTFESLAY
jgi:hypothetical protein